MRFRKETIEDEPLAEDPTAWLLNESLANFFLMDTRAIQYMCMLGYTFFHGYKLFPTFPQDSALSFKFVSMLFACTGGGIFVPIFVNAIPVPLAQDAYPLAILISFLLHEYVPILRGILKYSAVFKTAMIVLYETQRAYVVAKLTYIAGNAIAPSDFQDMAVFGPIFCGTIAGCGGAFLPLNKGLAPIQKAGMGQPMVSAFIGATLFHFFLHTSWSEGVVEPKKKAQIVLALFFIAYSVYSNFFDMVWKAVSAAETTAQPVAATKTTVMKKTTRVVPVVKPNVTTAPKELTPTAPASAKETPTTETTDSVPDSGAIKAKKRNRKKKKAA